jgi:NADH-quinone oxidoreductase subunit D
MNTIGGVRRDITPALARAALERLPALEDQIAGYVDLVRKQETVLLRFQGIGRITREQALSFGTVGPTARASGVDYDVRRDDPYCAYGEIPWNVVTDTHGDVYGKTIVRIGELRESVHMVRHCLENLPDGDIVVKAPRNAPPGHALSRYEAPRGELAHYIRTNGTDKADRLDVRTPTLANWTSVAASLVNQNLADIPVIVAAIDPCLSCTSRLTILDARGKKSGDVSWEELRRRARDLQQERGRC